jgi:hypothetical protein
MKDETPRTGILNFKHMNISFSCLIYFTCIHTSFLVQRDHTLWVWSIFFTPQDIIFYRYNFTHTCLILCSTSLHLYTYAYTSGFFIFYSQSVYQIQHFFTGIHCANNTRPSHYHISHYIFDLTFRDYCGIKLLLGHQYGSHYLYLNLKNLAKFPNITRAINP